MIVRNKRRCFLALLTIVFALVLSENGAESYRAVAVIHGVLTGSDSMDLISNRIQEVGFCGARSLFGFVGEVGCCSRLEQGESLLLGDCWVGNVV